MPLQTRLARGFFLSAILLLLATGCVPAVDMSKGSWMPAGEETGPAITLGNIEIKRPAARGGSDVAALGKVRGGFGNPFSVKAQSGKELDVIMRKSADAALQHAGYGIAGNSDSAPRLEIDVLEFWCDGYMAYTIKAKVEIRITRGGKVVASKTIETAQGFMINMSYSPMHDAFREVANRLTGQMADFLQSAETRQAL